MYVNALHVNVLHVLMRSHPQFLIPLRRHTLKLLMRYTCHERVYTRVAAAGGRDVVVGETRDEARD